MILSVCLSPCIDVTMEVESLNIGRVNEAKNKTLAYTGKSINVAIGVGRLGFESHLTGFMYRENGDCFERMLEQEKVPYSFIWNDGRVRENYKIIDNKSMMTQINTVSEPIKSDNLNKLTDHVAMLGQSASVLTISGGLPEGVPADYYATLLKTAKKGTKTVVDARGPRLLSALDAGVDLIKPSLEELEACLGRRLVDKDEVLAGCHELLDRGAGVVLLSLGKDGAIITDGHEEYYCKSINVAVNSTLGAGDAMVAAASTRLEQNADLKEVLRAGVAAGTASVTTFGTKSFHSEKFEEIYQTLTVVTI